MVDGLDKLFEIAEEEKVSVVAPVVSTGTPNAEPAPVIVPTNVSDVTVSNEAPTDEAPIDEDDSLELITKFKELTGYEGEIGDLTVESIAGVVKEIQQNVTSKYSLVDTDPEIKALVEWKAKGGTLEDYFSIPQKFDKTVFDAENEAHVEAVFKSYYGGLKQLNDEEVQEQVDLLKASPDKLKARFGTALDALEQNANSKYDAYIAKIESDKAKAIEDGKALEAVITAGDFGSIKVSKEISTEFSQYLNDKQKYDEKWKAFEADPKKVAIVEYLVYNDCDLSKLKGVVTPTTTTTRKVANLIRTSSDSSSRTKQDLSEDEQLEMLRSVKVR